MKILRVAKQSSNDACHGMTAEHAMNSGAILRIAAIYCLAAMRYMTLRSCDIPFGAICRLRRRGHTFTDTKAPQCAFAHRGVLFLLYWITD